MNHARLGGRRRADPGKIVGAGRTRHEDYPSGYWRQYSYMAIAAAVAALWLNGCP